MDAVKPIDTHAPGNLKSAKNRLTHQQHKTLRAILLLEGSNAVKNH